MDIVVCTDSNYVMPCGVMLYSICKNNQDTDITFHIIVDESVDSHAQKSIKELLFPESSKRAIFYLINGYKYRNLPRLDDTNPKKHITKAAYYRLYISDILPNNIDKVLYLDSDIIVRHSLTDLWNTELCNHAIGVIPDVAEGVIDKYNRLRYSPQKGYFNSGVLLINLKKWRDEGIATAFVDFMLTHPDWIKLHDQDVMNKILCDDKYILPIRYNFQEGFLWNDIFYDYWKYEKQVLDGRKDPVIIHYTDSKPWVEGCEHPFRDEFFKYQDETIWASSPLYTYDSKLGVRTIIKKGIKDFLRFLGVLSPLPISSPKYIKVEL